jgi:hypothetical protein
MLQNELNLFFETSSKSNLNVDMVFKYIYNYLFIPYKLNLIYWLYKYKIGFPRNSKISFLKLYKQLITI